MASGSEILEKIVPNISRVTFLHRRPGHARITTVVEIAAQKLGLKIQPREVQEASQFQSAYTAMSTERADALVIPRNPYEHAP